MTKRQKLDRLLREGPMPGDTLFMPILMHFAARAAGVPYADFCRDHRVRVLANLVCLDRYDVDCVTLMSDPWAETSAFGARIEYPDEAVPRCMEPVVRSADDARSLRAPATLDAERIVDRLEGARLYRSELGDTVPVVGWVEGPLAEACDLAGMTTMFMMLMTDPDASHRLLDTVLDFAKRFATVQIDAGCDVIGIGDAACSQVDAETYRTFILDRHRELIEHIHAAGAIVKMHICGDITHLLPDLATLPIDLIDLDWPVDIGTARETLGPGPVITGNIDPVRILGDPPGRVYERARALVAEHRAHRYVLAGGCEIGVDTPAENLEAMLRAAREPI